MMAKEYKKRGGDYNTPKESKDDSQKNLDNWGKEDWQTKEGSGQAKKEDGSRKRYLPKKAWEQMSEKEKKETDAKKQEQGSKDKQFVPNTSKAKDARKNARSKAEDENNDEGEGDDNDESNADDDADEDQADEKPTTPDKKKRGRKADDDGNKDQKKQKTDSKEGKKTGTIGSKHDKADAPAEQGSTDRLPKKGHKNVHWKALPGWVEGEVVEIVKSSKSVQGKQVKGSKDDPRIVLKSKSGKICVHKPDNVYFD